MYKTSTPIYITGKARRQNQATERCINALCIVTLTLLIATGAHAVDRDKRYICTAEISRAFVREDNSWRDYGSQGHPGFLVRALHPNELIGPNRPDVTWGIFPPGPDIEPSMKCREYASALECKFPGRYMDVNLSNGRFAEAIFPVGEEDFAIGISAGFCKEIKKPDTKDTSRPR